MKRRLLLSFMTIALVAALVGGATFASFSATATVGNNTFAAGTLTMGAGSQITTQGIDLSNLKPGDNIDGVITITNTGTLPFNLAITPVITPGSPNLFDANGGAVFTLGAVPASLAVGASATVTYNINWPNSGNQNALQGASATLSFTVNATQQ